MKQNLILRLCAVLFVMGGFHTALAQPTIISTIPASGATGVSPVAAVVFTFSTAMDADADVTFAQFYDFAVGFTPLPVVSIWSAATRC
ncbi:MAG: Ig-like domain-containing protein [Limisphaerales bacterium]